jgi:hypothetical protein
MNSHRAKMAAKIMMHVGVKSTTAKKLFLGLLQNVHG